MGKARVRAKRPRYIVQQIERMIANPNPVFNTHPQFMRTITERAHSEYVAGISPESHDSLVKAFATMKRDQLRKVEKAEARKPVTAENFRDSLFSGSRTEGSNVMEGSIVLSGKAPENMHFRTETLITPSGQYGNLHKLALKRLPGFRRDGWRLLGSHYTETPIGKERVITNHFFAPGNSDNPQGIYSLHVAPAQQAIVFSHLGDTWKRAFTARTPKDALRKVAEYEWWFYQANPTGRGGANIGDCMSASLRMSLGLPLDRRYAHRDYEALTLPLNEYVSMRTNQLKKLIKR